MLFVACGPLSPDQFAALQNQSSGNNNAKVASSISQNGPASSVTFNATGSNDLQYAILPSTSTSINLVLLRTFQIPTVRIVSLTTTTNLSLFNFTQSLLNGDLNISSAACTGNALSTITLNYPSGQSAYLTCPTVADTRYSGTTMDTLSQYLLNHL